MLDRAGGAVAVEGVHEFRGYSRVRAARRHHHSVLRRHRHHHLEQEQSHRRRQPLGQASHQT